jgi:CheY-like chemotaxis protein
MPDMDGVEFLRALRKQPVHRRTPVVLTTAEADDSELVKKPWSPQELRSIVQKVIESPPG